MNRSGSFMLVRISLRLFNRIAQRPPEAEARTEVGHLEGELILGSFNRSAIVTVFDRASRHLRLATPSSNDQSQGLCSVISITTPPR